MIRLLALLFLAGCSTPTEGCKQYKTLNECLAPDHDCWVYIEFRDRNRREYCCFEPNGEPNCEK